MEPERVSLTHHLEFLERTGHSIREVGDRFWFNSSPGIFSSLPYHEDVDTAAVDVGKILQRSGIALRYGCPLEQGVSSFRIICDDVQYDFPALRSRTRTQVRRGLECCRVEQVEFPVLKDRALPLNRDTLTRQGRQIPRDIDAVWQRYYAAAAETRGAEAWASFVGGDLAAYLIAFTIDHVCHLLIVRSATAHLDCFPNNALLFQFLGNRLRRGDIREVSYGFQSLQDDLGSLDQFKLGMGFRKAPAGQRVELNPWIRPIVNRLTGAVAVKMLRSLGKTENAGKLHGLLKWHASQPRMC